MRVTDLPKLGFEKGTAIVVSVLISQRIPGCRLLAITYKERIPIRLIPFAKEHIAPAPFL